MQPPNRARGGCQDRAGIAVSLGAPPRPGQRPRARHAVGRAGASTRRGSAGRLRKMSDHRPGTRVLSLTATCAAPVLYALLVRPRLLTWGATHEETSGTYPGDELIPDPAHSSTMAATLPAPPEQVWPWLVQMGY